MCILASVLVVVLESVRSLRLAHGEELRAAEWFFTGLFSVEYILRLVAVRRPLRYARSFFGLVDLAAILPTYLSLFLPGTQALLVIRALRLLRIFRILKRAHFLGEAQAKAALRASVRKITVFLTTVLILVVIIGALMYLVEGEAHGFTSIPQSIYWAIVTLTTVGYGDLAPATVLGKILASAVMILGYGIIAVPTGIVTVEFSRRPSAISAQACDGTDDPSRWTSEPPHGTDDPSRRTTGPGRDGRSTPSHGWPAPKDRRTAAWDDRSALPCAPPLRKDGRPPARNGSPVPSGGSSRGFDGRDRGRARRAVPGRWDCDVPGRVLGRAPGRVGNALISTVGLRGGTAPEGPRRRSPGSECRRRVDPG